MSFLAATRRTSIWPAPVSCSGGVRICTSMFTSLTSNGMYCSASHWMLSSSSFRVMRGMEIFLMITLWPETPMATSRFFSLNWLTSCRMASTMAVEFISAPSTIASGGSGATPKASSEKPRFPASLSCTSFTDEEPMSRPSASLFFAIARKLLRGSRGKLTPGENAPKKSSVSSRAPAAVPQPGKNLRAFLHGEAEGKEDLALGLHPAVLARLDAIDGRLGHASASRQFRLGHELGLAESLHVVHRGPDLHLRNAPSLVIRVGVKQHGCIEGALRRQYNSTAPASRKVPAHPPRLAVVENRTLRVGRRRRGTTTCAHSAP